MEIRLIFDLCNWKRKAIGEPPRGPRVLFRECYVSPAIRQLERTSEETKAGAVRSLWCYEYNGKEWLAVTEEVSEKEGRKGARKR